MQTTEKSDKTRMSGLPKIDRKFELDATIDLSKSQIFGEAEKSIILSRKGSSSVLDLMKTPDQKPPLSSTKHSRELLQAND